MVFLHWGSLLNVVLEDSPAGRTAYFLGQDGSDGAVRAIPFSVAVVWKIFVVVAVVW